MKRSGTTKNLAANLQEARHLVLYFQVHQPMRLNKVNFLDIGRNPDYFNDSFNSDIINRTASNCYLQVNGMLARLIKEHDNIRLTFSISGVAIRQFEKFAPEVLESFKELHATGAVELLAETSHHSLSSLMPNDEFIEQVKDHVQLMNKHFGVTPSVFRNTELIYSNSIGSRVAHLGFKGILCDGVERVLKNRNTYGLYQHPVHDKFPILLRSNRLSDDIGFRFTQGPRKLDVDSYYQWLENTTGTVTLGLDYETFGEHQPGSTGIIKFLRELLIKAATTSSMTMATPSEVFESVKPEGKLDVPDFVSWADESKDISAWMENEMQKDAFQTLQTFEEEVRRSGDQELIDTWRNLQTSDHFYYMSTKGSDDGNVHSYFSHYDSPYEAFINYMNILSDFKLRLINTHAEPIERKTIVQRENVPSWVKEEDVASLHDALASH
jgi:alpha-amylase